MARVNKILNSKEEMVKMKEPIKNLLQILVFISIASLPFISMTNILGIETFLDSFENPEAYICFKDRNQISGIQTNQESYIIIQISDHPSFVLEESDSILYYEMNGKIVCTKIHEIAGIGTSRKYYIEENEESFKEYPIYENQIIGKVVKVVDNNIWNELSIKLWEISINNLNPRK
jgi:hypothetical protein